MQSGTHNRRGWGKQYWLFLKQTDEGELTAQEMGLKEVILSM